MPISASSYLLHIKYSMLNATYQQHDKSRSGTHSISRRTHCAHQTIAVIPVDRLAQTAHVNVDGSFINFAVQTPNRINQLLARVNPALPFHQMAQQAEFGRAKVQNLAITANAVCGRVHFYRTT